MQVGQSGLTPVVARSGGGVYVAYATGYPSLNRIRVWKVGGSSSPVVGKATGGASATIATAADGRLWVAWEDDNAGDPIVYARRSNTAGTVWGATDNAGHPKGAAGAYHVDASAAGGSLDLLTSFVLGSGSPLATYHRRIQPGLTLNARPGSVRRGTAKVRFTVLDAGAPVRGARVKAGGASGKTNAKGKVRLTVHAAGRKLKARATAPGYAGAVRKLKVKR
jgi:hypothetical protein